MYSHSCCATCIRFGAALMFRRRILFLYCDMYLRTRVSPVVLDIELSVSAWYQKNRRVLLRATSSAAAAASCSREQRAAVCGVRHSFQNYIQRSGNKIAILCQSEHQKIAPHTKHPGLKKLFFFFWRSYVPAICYDKHQKCYFPHAYSAAHITATHPPAGIDGVRINDSVSLMRTSAGVLCLACNNDYALEA